ncbi:hypothetical protein [Govanella unica]|uniref:Uncharacterized protein n=1 Tax=Govanella unica TaxID=2975056 RepID=A0A9X3Z6S2_9PROT|nr:hypothetical protein [Govania unica]MDA5193441.1 hypothetical protein [Govania unica]
MRSLPVLDYDLDGIRRVARVLLKHVRPENRSRAYEVLDGRLGVYMVDRAMLRAEIDRYFQGGSIQAA